MLFVVNANQILLKKLHLAYISSIIEILMGVKVTLYYNYYKPQCITVTVGLQ